MIICSYCTYCSMGIFAVKPFVGNEIHENLLHKKLNMKSTKVQRNAGIQFTLTLRSSNNCSKLKIMRNSK